jgi:trehalose-phosphatase
MNPATRVLQPQGDPDRFFERLARTGRCALLLDYDGTLAPFHVDPARALPYAGIRERLNVLLAQHDTRLAIISGRWTRDLLPLLGLDARPEVWGSHGWERCHPDGRCETYRPDERALQALAQADHWTESLVALGARLEPKPAALAIHWRGLEPETVQRIRGAILEHRARHARDHGLEALDFDGGIELRAPGRNKADAVNAIAAESGDALIAYLGDDVTDDDAFRALRPGDLGVLVRPDFRPTAASLWLKPPEELLDFLDRWIECRRHAHA